MGVEKLVEYQKEIQEGRSGTVKKTESYRTIIERFIRDPGLLRLPGDHLYLPSSLDQFFRKIETLQLCASGSFKKGRPSWNNETDLAARFNVLHFILLHN